MATNNLVAALYALKEEATHAWKCAMNGDLTPLVNLGRTYKNLEIAVIEQDSAAGRSDGV